MYVHVHVYVNDFFYSSSQWFGQGHLQVVSSKTTPAEARRNRGLATKIAEKNKDLFGIFKLTDNKMVVLDSKVVEEHIRHCLHNSRKPSYVRSDATDKIIIAYLERQSYQISKYRGKLVYGHIIVACFQGSTPDDDDNDVEVRIMLAAL